jgi:hypothetical protein
MSELFSISQLQTALNISLLRNNFTHVTLKNQTKGFSRRQSVFSVELTAPYPLDNFTRMFIFYRTTEKGSSCSICSENGSSLAPGQALPMKNQGVDL